MTRVIPNQFNFIIAFSDEQQGFRSGKSWADAVVLLRQILEKLINYSKPALICFKGVNKVFDGVKKT